VASWPFEVWGLYVIGPLTPKSSVGHIYILVATDYFSKWVEAIALKEVKKENVVDFIRMHIIYRYGVPRYIVTDNGKPFVNKLMTNFCEKSSLPSISHQCTMPLLVEAFDKTLCNLLKNIISKSKRDWHKRLGQAIWVHRTTYKTTTQSTPYALLCEVDVILLLEIQILSLRIAIQESLSKVENHQLHLAELEALDEKRLQA